MRRDEIAHPLDTVETPAEAEPVAVAVIEPVAAERELVGSGR